DYYCQSFDSSLNTVLF
nr:immunoglobulin light chain junction region [Macaca mulatta]